MLQMVVFEERGGGSDQPPSYKEQYHCFWCGSDKHIGNEKKTWPAAKVKCKSCKKKGHFTKLWKSPVATERNKIVPELAILFVNEIQLMPAGFDKISCQLNVEAPLGNTQVQELIVDTGTSTSFRIKVQKGTIQTDSGSMWLPKCFTATAPTPMPH